MPCGENDADMGFHITFVVVKGIGVLHGIVFGISEKLRGRAFWGCAIERALKLGVTPAGCGRILSFRNFVSGWLRRNRA